MARYSAAKIIVRYHIDEPDEVTSDLAALAYLMTFSASDPATFVPVMRRTALDRLRTRRRPGHGDSSRLVRSISPNLKSIPDRLFDNDRGLAVGPEGRKLFERFLRGGNKLCRSCFNGKRGPSITLSTSHAADSSYLPRCNLAPPASAIQL